MDIYTHTRKDCDDCKLKLKLLTFWILSVV